MEKNLFSKYVSILSIRAEKIFKKLNYENRVVVLWPYRSNIILYYFFLVWLWYVYRIISPFIKPLKVEKYCHRGRKFHTPKRADSVFFQSKLLCMNMSFVETAEGSWSARKTTCRAWKHPNTRNIFHCCCCAASRCSTSAAQPQSLQRRSAGSAQMSFLWVAQFHVSAQNNQDSQLNKTKSTKQKNCVKN